MATRSTITNFTRRGEYETIYCHFDGYLSGNGKVLFENYTTYEKVAELIANGDLSVLGKDINPNPEFPHNFENPQKDVCVFYSRDRKEKNVGMNLTYRIEDIRQEEFNYIFKDDEWFLIDSKLNLKPLKDLLISHRVING